MAAMARGAPVTLTRLVEDSHALDRVPPVLISQLERQLITHLLRRSDTFMGAHDLRVVAPDVFHELLLVVVLSHVVGECHAHRAATGHNPAGGEVYRGGIARPMCPRQQD